MTAIYDFWTAQCPHEELLDALLLVFIDTLKYGPFPTIEGVRPCYTFSHVEDTVGLSVRWRRKEWKTEEYPRQDGWDNFTEVADSIRKQWPKTITLDGMFRQRCLEGAVGHLTEFTYDKRGRLKTANKDLASVHDVPTTTGSTQTYGRLWNLRLENRSINTHLLAVIVYLAKLGHDLGPSNVGYCSAAFAIRYAGIWPRTNWTRWCCRSASVCHLQFHIRYFSAVKPASTSDQLEGPILARQLSQSSLHGMGRHVESRMAIALNTTLVSNPGYYSMVSLGDYAMNASYLVEGSNGIKLSPDKRFIGITIFQMGVMHLLGEAKTRWGAFLRSIKMVLDMELADRERTVLEIPFQSLLDDLRTAENWIKATASDLESLKDDVSNSTKHICSSVIQENWKVLLQYHEESRKCFLRQKEKEETRMNTLKTDLIGTYQLRTTESLCPKCSSAIGEEVFYFLIALLLLSPFYYTLWVIKMSLSVT